MFVIISNSYLDAYLSSDKTIIYNRNSEMKKVFVCDSINDAIFAFKKCRFGKNFSILELEENFSKNLYSYKVKNIFNYTKIIAISLLM